MIEVERRPLRILHTEASKGWGGQEIRILEESAGLRRRGHDVRLATPQNAPIFAAAERRGIPVHALPLDRRRPGPTIALARLIVALRPDVLVTHSSSDSWLAALATRLPGASVPIVRVRHLSTRAAPGPLNRWLYGRVPSRVVTTGEAIRKALVASLKLTPDRVRSIPTGIDVERFVPGDRVAARARLKLPQDETLIGIVATLRNWKGHRYLIEALRKDPRLSRARLIIVGAGPQEEILREQAEGLGERVIFAGQQDDVVPWMHASDVFALPSTGNEGVPQALVQAMACRLPVISTPVGAIPEIVHDGDTGLLVPPADVKALADAIVRLQADSALAARLAAAGRAFVTEHLTIAAMLDAMEALFWQAVSENRNVPRPGSADGSATADV